MARARSLAQAHVKRKQFADVGQSVAELIAFLIYSRKANITRLNHARTVCGVSSARWLRDQLTEAIQFVGRAPIDEKIGLAYDFARRRG